MMRISLIITFLFCSVYVAAHQIPIAFFNIDIEDNNIHLMIQFDADDLDYAVSSFYGGLVKETKPYHTALISKYVNSHLSLAINRNDISTIIQKIEREGDHYFITLASSCLDEAIHLIEIKNECLIHQIDQHSNIIRLHQTGQAERGFRLHEDRIATTIHL